MSDKIAWKNITIIGSGTLGSQIAFQTAYKGYNVNIYDINQEAIDKAKERIQDLYGIYQMEIDTYEKQVDNIDIKKTSILPDIQHVWSHEKESLLQIMAEAMNRIHYFIDLKEAVADADLVIEAIPEVPKIKTDFYHQLAEVAPEKTIFVTNSSTLLPSEFAKDTGRPEKFLALHFANEIWKNNTAEIMGHDQTDPAVYQDVVTFAKSIGMVTIEVQKEQSGYVLNSLLVPFLDSALGLFFKGVATPETIDKTWMVATKSQMGPFAIIDVVGMQTAYNILIIHEDEISKKIAHLIKTEFMDKGKYGVASGEGFYKYPNPSYLKPNFTKE